MLLSWLCKWCEGLRLWDPVACKVIVSRDVSFDEPRSLKEEENAHAPRTDKGKSPLSDIVEGKIDHYGFNDRPQGELPEQREDRVSRAPTRYGSWANSSNLHDRELEDRDDDGNAFILEEGEPSSYREAQASTDKLEWDASMEQEMQSLNDNKTWKLVKLPPGQQVVDSKWVYKLKDSPTESVGKIYLVATSLATRPDSWPMDSHKRKTWTIMSLDEIIFKKQPIAFVKKSQE
ncbi:hypothetical protein AXG93_3337s1030 [Marchantia polymorpha subsp. ruderalis]|uniref:Reverse transcriptase Ty1/copia-type domain-containing protein n=1 Tax=Marchantia polymorpha subsp. ruderalis TaxID=1480154 RepID=A0A176W4V1_MARPO|nr:hypothetical protein AXG93_3337s1030 [Marchantia polymorpha subsp. ruderalis]